MKIVGCDLHTRYQQIAMLDQETGELIERRLEHESGEARAFYAALSAPVRVGIEATGHTRWFERMLAELGHELWIGDAAQIRASMVRKHKDRCARRGARGGFAVKRALPAHLAADAGGARSAATGVASAEAGGCAMRWATSCTPWPWAKGCAERKSCSPRKAGRNWKAWRSIPGRVIAGRNC
jgi:hypothetical protein